MDKIDPKQLEMAAKIQALRQSRGMSITELARLLTITRQAVYSIENGTRKVKVGELKIVSSHFRVTFETLYGEPETARSAAMPVLAKIEDVELLIASDLSRLRPGVLDRIIRLVGPIRAARRKADVDTRVNPAARDVSKAVQQRINSILEIECDRRSSLSVTDAISIEIDSEKTATAPKSKLRAR